MSPTTLYVTALILVIASVHCQRDFRGPRSRNPNNDRRGFGRARGGPNSDPCRQKVMDLYFVLDSSTSIYRPDYERVLDFVKDVVSRLHVSPQYTRVGMVTFSNNYNRPPISLSQSNTKRDVLNSVTLQNLPYRTGITNTHLALRYVREDPEFRRDITKVMVVVTDGGSRSPGATAREARLAREEGFYMFVVGIGQFLEESEWRSIASDPDSSFIFNITNFNLLDEVKITLPRAVCPLPPITSEETCIQQHANLMFAAAPGGALQALDLIEHFAQTHTDRSNLLQVSYVMDMCDGGNYQPLGSHSQFCHRNVSPRETDSNTNQFLLDNVQRVASGSGRGPQVLVLFLNDDMVRRANTQRGIYRLYNKLQSISRRNVNIILVNLGVEEQQAQVIQRMRIEDIVTFSQQPIHQQPSARNNFNDVICQALNRRQTNERTTLRPIGPA